MLDRLALADASVCLSASLARREGAADTPYMLMAGFPPKPLTDQAATIEASGLKMGQVTQKLA